MKIKPAFCFVSRLGRGWLGAASLLAVAPLICLADNPPAGADGEISIQEDTPYLFNALDFGFSDIEEVIPHVFKRVKITTLPNAGSLSVDGIPVTLGQSIQMGPVPGIVWSTVSSGRNWRKVASSADGTKLVAIQLEGPIHLSNDSGATWSTRESSRKWIAVASSADGLKLAAAEGNGKIYVSSDSGQTWTARESDRNWVDIDSSSDGSKLVAIENGGKIYTSTDSGATWIPRETNQYWVSIACSADGNKLVALPYTGPTYYSSDSGVTWTPRGSDKSWSDVASSADGERLVAVEMGGKIYRSGNSGMSWQVVHFTNRPWSGLASSADGARLAAVEAGMGGADGRIYTSIDFGATWTPRGIGGQWRAITSSADGAKLVALGEVYAHDGEVHTSTATVPQLLFTPADNASGTPHAAFAFQVGDDGSAGSDLDLSPNLFTVNVTSVNDAPVAVGSLSAQTPEKDLPFTFQFPLGTFSDVDDGAVLTYAAALDNGSPLPGWLAFDPGTRTFSGTPGSTDEGTIKVRITATDNGSPPLQAHTAFLLGVSNDPPVGTDGSVTINEDTPYLIRAADYGFTDSNDLPPNRFVGVTIASLPAAGTLTTEGTAVTAGDFFPMFPESRKIWTPRENSRNWSGVASSADGTKLVAVAGQSVSPGWIYTSMDSGATWTPRESARRWTAVASSADGTRLAAASTGQIYSSTDSGVTWTARAEALNWSAIASSADGIKLAATVVQGRIYTSSDAGVTWVARAEALNWSAIAASADGTKLVAAEDSGQIYTSTDSGVTWTPRESNRNWWAVASSADGVKLVAAGNEPGGFPGRIFTSSDSGLTWIPREANRNWKALASSADGTKLVAAVYSGQIYTSRDSGETWLARDISRSWFSCAASADGSKLVAVDSFGKIHTSAEAVPELIFTPVKNASGNPYAGFTFQVEDDGTGLLTRDPTPKALSIHVTAVNDAPMVSVPVPDKSAVERTAVGFQLASNTFTDADPGTVLTYVASLANQAALPAWLSFNPATRSFSGTPGPADTGLFDLQVTATDDGSPPLQKSVTFLLSVANVSEVPAGADGLANLTGLTAHTFTAADFGFTDPGDFPADRFSRVRLTTLPALGMLTIDGLPATAGDFGLITPAEVGARWTPHGATRNWYSIASSADGTKWVAVEFSGWIHTSTDSGLTWTQRGSFSNWYSVDSSADGTKLAVVENAGRIHTSMDSGVTWSPHESTRNWRAITSSSDGSKLAAIVPDNRIYTSDDSGTTWTPRENARAWYGIDSSSDGTKLAAVVQNGQIYTSTDSGVLWTARESNRNWRAIASGADGTKLAAIVQNGRIYTSTDSGVTWTARESNRNWYYIASSADGVVLAAVEQNGRIYTSADSGVTWAARETSRSWRAVASSADGSRLAAILPQGKIFLSASIPAQSLVYTPPADGVGTAQTSFTFQVEDEGLLGANLDPTPNNFTLTLPALTPFGAWAREHTLSGDPAANGGLNLLNFAFGLNPYGSSNGGVSLAGEVIASRGFPAIMVAGGPDGTGFAALFGRRKNSGLTYTMQFAAGLDDWEDSAVTPLVMADDGLVEACRVPFPAWLANGKKPRFFRVSVGMMP